MLYFLAKNLCRLFFLLVVPTSIQGIKNIPKKGPFILASNHVSYLDPPLIGGICPRSLLYLARSTLFRPGFIDWFLRKVHLYPLRRNTADLSALRAALKYLKNNGGILLFPEGTRSQNAKLQRGLAGVGFLARKSGACVIPVCVKETERAMPPGRRLIRPVRARVVFGRPIFFERDKHMTDEDFTFFVMERIRALKKSHRVLSKRK